MYYLLVGWGEVYVSGTGMYQEEERKAVQKTSTSALTMLCFRCKEDGCVNGLDYLSQQMSQHF